MGRAVLCRLAATIRNEWLIMARACWPVVASC